MNDIERLSNATTALANHVAAVVRMSNELDGMLKDAVKPDMAPATRLAVLSRIKDMHDTFRLEHFRGAIASVNTVVEIVDQLYQAEPAEPESGSAAPPEVPLPETPNENAPVVQLADIPETPDAAPVA